MAGGPKVTFELLFRVFEFSGVCGSVGEMAGHKKRCPGHCGDTLGTLFGHSGARGPKGPRDTQRDTPGTLQARRARETPVAGWAGCNFIAPERFGTKQKNK